MYLLGITCMLRVHANLHWTDFENLEGTIFFIRYMFCLLDRNNMFGDDSRLSHLVKRITKDSERDRRLTAVQQLEEFLNNADNQQVVNIIIIIIKQNI